MNKSWIASFFNANRRLLIIFFVVLAVMAMLSPGKFLRMANFSSMAFQFPELAILALGMMLALIAGGIDLSMVGIANLSGVLAALLLVKAQHDAQPSIILVLLALVLAVLCGAACGTLNGLLISKAGIPPILTTLGSMQFFTGIAVAITKGPAIYNFPDLFLTIGNGSLGPIPLSLFILSGIILILAVVLRNTVFGNHLYLMGSNPIAAHFSNIHNVWVTIRVYMLSGILASLAGIIIIARANSAKADYGVSYTLQALLVAILGGIDPAGGKGRVSGVILAVLILQMLSSGFNMLPQFNNFFKDFVWGAVLVLVMIFNYYQKQQKRKSTKQS